MRNTWRFFDYEAICECGWECHGKNALGVAAQHHDRTGHTVSVTVSGTVSYLSDAEDAARKAERNQQKGGE